MWALFCRVLLRKMNYLRGQLGAVPVDNAAELVDAFGRKLGGEALPVRFDVAVNTKLVAHEWLRRFASQRVALIRQVPGRSREPDRYRDLIFTAAEGVLAAIVAGDFREADLNLALHAAYQEWFGEDGVAVRNIHQRFARARADVCALLRNIISVEEVYA